MLFVFLSFYLIFHVFFQIPTMDVPLNPSEGVLHKSCRMFFVVFYGNSLMSLCREIHSSCIYYYLCMYVCVYVCMNAGKNTYSRPWNWNLESKSFTSAVYMILGYLNTYKWGIGVTLCYIHVTYW